MINSGSASSAPAGYRFPREVIAVAVRWYLRYGLSYRDVEELLAERFHTPPGAVPGLPIGIPAIARNTTARAITNIDHQSRPALTTDHPRKATAEPTTSGSAQVHG